MLGVGEDSWPLEEKYEEARYGCPRQCQRLAKSKDDTVCDSEAKFAIAQIEEMVDAFGGGEQLDPKDYEIWKWELFIYWIKTEKDFQRNIWVKIGFAADSFLKQR